MQKALSKYFPAPPPQRPPAEAHREQVRPWRWLCRAPRPRPPEAPCGLSGTARATNIPQVQPHDLLISSVSGCSVWAHHHFPSQTGAPAPPTGWRQERTPSPARPGPATCPGPGRQSCRGGWTRHPFCRGPGGHGGHCWSPNPGAAAGTAPGLLCPKLRRTRCPEPSPSSHRPPRPRSAPASSEGPAPGAVCPPGPAGSRRATCSGRGRASLAPGTSRVCVSSGAGGATDPSSPSSVPSLPRPAAAL